VSIIYNLDSSSRQNIFNITLLSCVNILKCSDVRMDYPLKRNRRGLEIEGTSEIRVAAYISFGGRFN